MKSPARPAARRPSPGLWRPCLFTISLWFSVPTCDSRKPNELVLPAATVRSAALALSHASLQTCPEPTPPHRPSPSHWLGQHRLLVRLPPPCRPGLHFPAAA